MNDEENPWSVNNLDVYLYYCCPECDVNFNFWKNKSKELFLEHALKEHKKAKDCLLLNAKVRLEQINEPFKDITNSNLNFVNEILKCC